MWKNYRMWFGAGYSKPYIIIRRQDPPYELKKKLKPTQTIFRARNEKEAMNKIRKFMIAAEITGRYDVEEITKEQPK